MVFVADMGHRNVEHGSTPDAAIRLGTDDDVSETCISACCSVRLIVDDVDYGSCVARCLELVIGALRMAQAIRPRRGIPRPTCLG
jgi:hypothetical protein